ncbi:MAG: EamA family transporter [Rhodospirillaceae bacterium]|nr:MAG: EamA family transporter [Rhodospirillaceae bacterium]
MNTSKINTAMTPVEWGLLILLSILWGGSFFFNGVIVKELPTFTVVVSRVALAAMILWLVMKFTGRKMPMTGPVWTAFLVMGLLNNVIPFSLIVWGQIHIASGVASILNATTPLFTVLVAHGMTADEKLTLPRIFGVLLGLAGVAVMIGIDVTEVLSDNVLAQFACLGAGLSYAFAGVYGRRFKSMGLTPMATATGQVTASSIVLLPIVMWVDQPWTLAMPSAPVIGAVLGIASVSTALAYLIYFRILATAGATNILLVTFLVPVSAIILGIMVLDEVLLKEHLMGMALIGLGLAAIDGRLLKIWRKS